MRGSAVPTIVWSRDARKSTSSTAPRTAKRARGASGVASVSRRSISWPSLCRSGSRAGTAGTAPRRLLRLPYDLLQGAAGHVVDEASHVIAMRHERAGLDPLDRLPDVALQVREGL